MFQKFPNVAVDEDEVLSTDLTISHFFFKLITSGYPASLNNRAAASSFSLYSLSCYTDKSFKQPLAGQAFDGKQLHFISARQRFSVVGVCTGYAMSTVHPGGCQQGRHWCR